MILGVSNCMTEVNWSEHKDFAYQLQGYQFDILKDANFSLYILDASVAGNSTDRIKELKDAFEGERHVLCYLSIGEAYTYY